MTIDLDQDEVSLLHNMIEKRIEELGPEIHHTDKRAYRELLNGIREKLQRIDERLVGAKP